MNFSSGENVLIVDIKDVVKRELHILETYLRTLQKYVLFSVIREIFLDLVGTTLPMKSMSVYVHSFQIYEYITTELFFLRQSFTLNDIHVACSDSGGWEC